MSLGDAIQLVGALFVLSGSWLVGRTVKWGAAALAIGCALWAAWTFVVTPWPVYLFVLEGVLGLMLLFGWQTRIVALLLALHLFDIMYVVGYGEIGVRDFGLAVATLVVAMNGYDPLSLSGSKKADLISNPTR